MPAMTPAQLHKFLEEHFPQVAHFNLKVEHVDDTTIRVRLPAHERNLRPGGTISGPTMMALADFAMYVALLSSIGPVALAVTTNLNINFLRRPAPRDLVADAHLLKLGKRLAVGEVTIRSEGEDEPVAHVTATYSIPPQDGD